MENTIIHQRKQIRLTGYDYESPGWYFVTICAKKRLRIFGKIDHGIMILNIMGKLVQNIWETLPDHHFVQLDAFQIMPDHVHFILICNGPLMCRGIARNAPTSNVNPRNAPTSNVDPRNAPTMVHPPTFGNVTAGSLPCVIRSFKSECTKQIRRLSGNAKMEIWQRNYYEHIIRNEQELYRIQKYIRDNPKNWGTDRNNE